MSEAAVVAAPRWIVSPRYDLLWFFGGAAASLAVLALHFGAGVPILLLWWSWILLFDGPHIAAAFTRTYVDRQEWKTRPGVLLGSLLAFAVGPLFLVATWATGSPDPFSFFLAFAAFYGYYHIVRQHYGFVALYRARNRDFDRVDFHVDKWFLYIGCWAPYLYFLFTHPRAKALLRLPVEPGAVERVAVVVTVALWGAALLVFLARFLRRPAERLRQPHVAYALVSVALTAVIYAFVARAEPVYRESNGPDQDFLLLSVLTTLFHNIQYLGLVWFHNRNRYSTAEDFGPARALNRTPARFLLGCLAFSATIYLLSACATGVFPRCSIFTSDLAGKLGLCVWWGIGIHHYVLDAKIWRIRGDQALKRNLGLV